MTYIKRITMSGFKSFGNRTVSVKMAKGFTCIIGPNGNGKSNVIDALCFALGRMSKKTMRAKSLTDLIFAGSKTTRPAARAEVEITFDNKTKEFPVDAEEYKIARWIKAKGSSGYKIQGKKATRELILNALAQANIDPDGSNQFVLQGKIVELTHMNTVARRIFIETLIGLEKYDKMKEQTLKELEKADADLGQFEAIFKEVSSQLKKVEKEKNDALAWKDLDNKIRLYNSQLIALRIFTLREEEQQIGTEMEETALIIEELESKIARQKDKLEAEGMLLKNIDEEIAVATEEKDKLDENLSAQKSELSAKQATLAASKESITKLQKQIKKLEELQDKLEEGQTYDDLIKLTDEEIAGVDTNIDEAQSLIDESVAAQKQLVAEIAEINKQISKEQQEIKAFATETKMLEKNIRKNAKKLSAQEKELNRLMKKGQDIEEAIASTNAEAETIQSEIDSLRKQIEEQRQTQKDLDKEIKKLEGDRDKVTKKSADISAAISSASGAIDIYERSIQDLEEKKKKLQKEFDRLTKGKQVEDQIKELKAKEDGLLADLKAAKDELSKLTDEQKNSQSKKETLEFKRRALESQQGDIDKRLSGLRVELKNAQAELKVAERESGQAASTKSNLEKEMADLTAKREKAAKAADSIRSKIEKLNEHRAEVNEQVEKKEAEKEETSGELNTILTSLQELTENIDRSAGDIKSDIQNASQVAIDESARVLGNFVRDITDMLSSIEEVAGLEEGSEIKQQLQYTVDTLRLLLENSEEPINAINLMVKEASDEALEESTRNFDGFIRDFIEKFDSIRVALQAVAVSDTTELLKTLDRLNSDIQRESGELSGLDNQLSTIEVQLAQKTKELSALDRTLSELAKKIEDNKARVEKGEKENTDKAAETAEVVKQVEEITAQLAGIKEFSDNYWKKQKEVQSTIDTRTEELAGLQADLTALSNVKRILDDIEAAGAEQEKYTADIAKKRSEISDLNTSGTKITEELDAVTGNMESLRTQRAAGVEAERELQNKVDEQNELMKDVAARLKDLQSVQKLIDEIATLTAENEESDTKIQENTKGIEELGVAVTELEAKIAGIETQRTEMETQESGHRADLKELNRGKNDLEKKRDGQMRMKARDEEIEGLYTDLDEADELVTELEEGIQAGQGTIETTEQTRSDIIETIRGLEGQRSDSWNTQKSMQEALTDLNADFSRNSAKQGNLEQRKIVVEERIDELFEQSKDYGTLPPVTDDLAEGPLNNNIATASADKKSLEPVNLKSIEEYDEVKERWDEIDMRRQTLQRERKAIIDSLDRIELEKTRNFMKAFHEVNRVFSEVFQKLSPGGSAKMTLENPAHPFEGGITIEARPRGKKISSLNILSGGEKTLVALSFIFAVQNFYPAPFYIMDEIDAALDGPNVYRVSMVIKEYASQSQFIVISHREENITNADIIYGVAMNDGITDVFTVDLEEEKERDDFDAPIEGTEDERDDDTPIILEDLSEDVKK